MIRLDQHHFLLQGSGSILLDDKQHHPVGFKITIPNYASETRGLMFASNDIVEKMRHAKKIELQVGPHRAFAIDHFTPGDKPGEAFFIADNPIFSFVA
jgi:hypothetical protein